MTRLTLFLLTTLLTMLILHSSSISHVKSIEQTTIPNIIITVPDNSTKIQDVVDSANPGDTIVVKSGIYHELLKINKTIELVGEDPKTTIIDGSSENSSGFSPTIYVYSGTNAANVRISNFTIKGSSNAWGIYVPRSTGTNIANNILMNNSGGILISGDNCTLTNNTVMNNRFEGVLLLQSFNTTMRNNTIMGNTYNFGLEITSTYFRNDIDTSNLVNGKPIRILTGLKNAEIDPSTYPDIGYLALINCTNVNVENLTMRNNYNGVLLVDAQNLTISNSTFENNMGGVEIQHSQNTTLRNDGIIGNSLWGLGLYNSPSTLTGNELTGNRHSIEIVGAALGDYVQDIDASNTVDDKAIQYLINKTDLTIDPSTFLDIGYLGLVNCRNITVLNVTIDHSEILAAYTNEASISQTTVTNGSVTISHSFNINITSTTIEDSYGGATLINSQNITIEHCRITSSDIAGIQLRSTSNSTFFCNDVRNNTIGIQISQYSHDNVFHLNNIEDNRNYGVLILDADRNTFYHNNFTNHIPYQVISSFWGSENIFDNGYPAGGNYWLSYNGTDFRSGSNQDKLGSDGIGDVSYISYGEIDHYPLIQPIHAYPAGSWLGHDQIAEIVSNSIISDFDVDVASKIVRFNVTGPSGSPGFCRIAIPEVIRENMWGDKYTVIMNNQPIAHRNWTDIQNTYIYVNYTHSMQEIAIVPESLTTAFMAVALVIAAAITLLDRARARYRNEADGV